ncbi:hypothetical protein GGF46_000291 [Coemansia sp. RSA 552]|nr:hypothetical protein GGF46_000291 [Coemansia sp. RSA 552]
MRSRVMDCLSLSLEDTCLMSRQGDAARSRRNTRPRQSIALGSPTQPIHVPGSDSEEGKEGGVPGSPSSVTTLPSPRTSSVRSYLHERFSALLQGEAIEEEYGEDGVVIHNGLKRLSMSEVGLLKRGRPRVVNM